MSNNPLLQAKTYWSILKTFYNEKKNPDIWKRSNIILAHKKNEKH